MTVVRIYVHSDQIFIVSRREDAQWLLCTFNGNHTTKQQWTQVAFALRALGISVPLQTSTGPKLSRRLRLPRFPDNRNMKVAILSVLRTGRLYPPWNIPGTHFCYRLSRLQGHNALQVNEKFKWHHRESNPRCASTKSATECPQRTTFIRVISRALLSQVRSHKDKPKGIVSIVAFVSWQRTWQFTTPSIFLSPSLSNPLRHAKGQHLIKIQVVSSQLRSINAYISRLPLAAPR